MPTPFLDSSAEIRVCTDCAARLATRAPLPLVNVGSWPLVLCCEHVARAGDSHCCPTCGVECVCAEFSDGEPCHHHTSHGCTALTPTAPEGR